MIRYTNNTEFNLIITYEIMQKVGNREHVEFVEIYKEFIDEDYSKLLSDGVHMNDEGHKKIYEKVKDFLIEKNIIKIS